MNGDSSSQAAFMHMSHIVWGKCCCQPANGCHLLVAAQMLPNFMTVSSLFVTGLSPHDLKMCMDGH